MFRKYSLRIVHWWFSTPRLSYIGLWYWHVFICGLSWNRKRSVWNFFTHERNYTSRGPLGYRTVQWYSRIPTFRRILSTPYSDWKIVWNVSTCDIITRCQNSEDHDLNLHHRENIKSCTNAQHLFVFCTQLEGGRSVLRLYV